MEHKPPVPLKGELRSEVLSRSWTRLLEKYFLNDSEILKDKIFTIFRV